jgi:hypothetical protein
MVGSRVPNASGRLSKGQCRSKSRQRLTSGDDFRHSGRAARQQAAHQPAKRPLHVEDHARIAPPRAGRTGSTGSYRQNPARRGAGWSCRQSRPIRAITAP